MHDPRIGRFFAVDPLAAQYPHNSPYAFSENRVIDGVELEGLEYQNMHGRNMIAPQTQTMTVQADQDYDMCVSQDEWSSFMGAGAGSVVIGGTAFLTGTALIFAAPLIVSGLEAGLIWSANPANQALAVEGAGFVAALFYDGPEDLSPGGGDELGRLFKKGITPLAKAAEYIFKSKSGEEISVGTAKVMNGILEMDFNVPGDLQGKGIGTVMFNDAVKNLGEVDGIRGLWVEGANLDQFRKALEEGKSMKDAIFSTPTGKWAESKGFSNFEIKGSYAGDDGYEGVEIIFTE